MRAIYILSIIIFSYSNLCCQEVAPDFTVTDITGQSHTLYDYLDDGKVVILDFFAVWCSPCQVNAPGVESIWEERGPNGTNEVMILGLEADSTSTDAETAQYATDYNCNNPQINDTGDLNAVYEIDFYPTYYVVCPDRTIYKYEGDTPSEIEEALNLGIDQCAPYLDFQIDARIFSYNSSTTVCSENTVPNVRIMNMGQQDLTSLTIKTYLDNDLESTYDWTGFLPLFDSENVALPSVSLVGSSNPEISVTIEGPNGAEDPNPVNDSVNVAIVYGGATYETTSIHFELAFDNFPQETNWEFKDSQGEVILSGGDYMGFPDFSPPIDTTLQLPLGDCYTFTIYDAYGDGICCSFADPGEGFWRISTEDGILMGEGGEFGDEESLLFGIAGSVGLSDNEHHDLSTIYPNPNQGEFTLDLSAFPEDTRIRIFDMRGKDVFLTQAEAYSIENVDLHISQGTYLIEISSESHHLVERLVVE